MNKDVIKRLLKYLNKNIVSLVITFVLAIASVLLTIYVPILFGNAIDLIVDKDNVNFDGLNIILFNIFVIILIIAILQWVMMMVNNHVAYRMTKQLRYESDFTTSVFSPWSNFRNAPTNTTIYAYLHYGNLCRLLHCVAARQES